MKTLYKGFIIKVTTWGDTTTRLYRYRLYKPRKWWLPKLLWIEDLHKDKMPPKISDNFDWLIGQYEREVDRWK